MHMTGDAGDGLTAHPDLTLLIHLQVDVPITPECAALAGLVAFWGKVAGDQPLGEGRVEASGDGIFVEACRARKKASDLEGKRTLSARADQAQKVDIADDGGIGLSGQHQSVGCQHHTLPRRAVVAPLMRDHITGRQAQTAGDLIEYGGVQRATAASGRGSKGQNVAFRLDVDQPCRALLNDLVRFRLASGLQPGMAGAQSWMTGKGQFLRGGENPQLIIGAGICRLQHKGGFGQIGPIGKLRHLRGAEPVGIENNGHRIARKRLAGKYIDLLKCPSAHCPPLALSEITDASMLPFKHSSASL